MSETKQDVSIARTHIPGWPKTPLQMLERIEKRWQELEAREVSNHDFRCLMSDVSDFIHEHKEAQDEMLTALKSFSLFSAMIGKDGRPSWFKDDGAWTEFVIADEYRIAAIAKAGTQ